MALYTLPPQEFLSEYGRRKNPLHLPLVHSNQTYWVLSLRPFALTFETLTLSLYLLFLAQLSLPSISLVVVLPYRKYANPGEAGAGGERPV
jgi:hypothetical protein